MTIATRPVSSCRKARILTVLLGRDQSVLVMAEFNLCLNMTKSFLKRSNQLKVDKLKMIFLNDDMEAEIVETTFVVSRFSDIRNETTSFLVVPQKMTRNDACLVSDLKNTRPGTTRNDQKRTN